MASAEGVIIPASGSAKWKTAIQMVAIGFLIAFGFHDQIFDFVMRTVTPEPRAAAAAGHLSR